VTRALRLIAAGAMTDAGVEPLAERLGIGPRHLHRLFMQHLGASPIDVAQMARIEFAKRLIDDTALPMTDVALASGFRSVRRFNAAFQRAYGRPPTTLRRAAAAQARTGPAEYRLRLAYRPPFDWESLLAFLRPRAITGVEHVTDEAYARTIAFGGTAGRLEVRHRARFRALELTIRHPDPAALPFIVARVRTLFDLGADPQTVSRALGRDALLGPLVARRPGLRIPGAWDPFETAVRAIAGQQVSVRAAITIVGRLATRFGTPIAEPDASLGVTFPSAATLARADLTSVGLMRSRAATLQRLASAVAGGTIALDAGVDGETLAQQLTSIPGIGPWTAQYVALRGLGDPDAFPAEDLGLRIAAGGDRRLSTADLRARAEAWRPWRGYAALHLWHSLAG
jgi:AraC family transcriptional regulator of adaptative response / DNA-3-methyladenine glycosylase II